MTLTERCDRLYQELQSLAFPKVSGPQLLEDFTRELLTELSKRLDSKLATRDGGFIREDIRWAEIDNVLREYADALDAEGTAALNAPNKE